MSFQKYLENIRMGLDTLRAYKLRSALTVLGVVVGVAVVVVIASLVTGMRGQVLQQMEQFGTDNIYITQFSRGASVGARRRREMQNPPLKVEYAQALKRGRFIEDVSYQSYGVSPVVRYRDAELNSPNFSGVSPNLIKVTRLNLRHGRFLAEMDGAARRSVCVIGPAVTEALFPHEANPAGKRIRVAGREFRVVGVLGKAKAMLGGASFLDSSVFIPYQTYKKLYPRSERLQLTVQAKSGHLDEAYAEAEEILRRLRGLRASEENNFSFFTFEAMVNTLDEVAVPLIAVALAVSAISLLVGGIGVMNIMLVSVTERTREIGVRKALGALRRDILFQFLFEALTLTVAGGLAGLLLAVGVSSGITSFYPAMPAQVPMWAVLAAVGVSSFVGLFFGVFPAYRAAQLDPIECLRYE